MNDKKRYIRATAHTYSKVDLQKLKNSKAVESYKTELRKKIKEASIHPINGLGRDFLSKDEILKLIDQ